LFSEEDVGDSYCGQLVARIMLVVLLLLVGLARRARGQQARCRARKSFVKLADEAHWFQCRDLCTERSLTMPCIRDAEENFELVHAMQAAGDARAWLDIFQWDGTDHV
jgi:hypothetical protein